MKGLLFSLSGTILLVASVFNGGTDGWLIYSAGMLNLIMAEICSVNDKRSNTKEQ